MVELNAIGETAQRAAEKRKEAAQLEEEARASSDNSEYREKTEMASRLKDEALDLEKASRWFACLDRLETLGRNRGTQKKTLAKIKFLRAVADSIGGASREAIAAECLENHSGTVRRLWRAEGEKARSKMLIFMKNQKVP